MVDANTRVTIFQNIEIIDKPYIVTLGVVLDRIKDGKTKELLDKIRSTLDKDSRNDLKKKLPSILFSGEFRKRNMASLTKHSGIICLDYDSIDGLALKEKLKKDPFVMAAFISPSGNQGLKVLVKIPDNDHKASFLALEQHFVGIDKSGKDVSRVCYESYDPDIYINWDSEVFTEQIEITYEHVTIDKPVENQSEIYEYLKRWLEKSNEHFTEGNRNNFLFKMACACNRFGIDQETCKINLIYDFVNGTSNFKITELELVVKSAYKNTAQFNTAAFDRGEIVTKESRKKITQELLDETLPPQDAIMIADIWEDMLKEFLQGIKKGETTHIPEIDKHFRWARKEITLLYGIGNHGKTSIMLFMMMLKSIHDGYRWAIFSPEQDPPNDFYNDLIEFYIGASSMGGADRMSVEDYKRGMRFVQDHFYYIYPKTNDHTPEYILDRFREIIIKKKVDGVMIDPFNQLQHSYSGREDEYLSETLKVFKRFSQINDCFFIVVAHCNGKVDINRDSGEIRTPYYTSHIAGGAMWGNKMDNILCYHRPSYRSNPDSTSCLLSSQKIKKQKRNGRTGWVELEFDIPKRRFHPEFSPAEYRRVKDLQEQMDEATKNIDKEAISAPEYDPIIRRKELDFDKLLF